jgi:hypothetical protein
VRCISRQAGGTRRELKCHCLMLQRGVRRKQQNVNALNFFVLSLCLCPCIGAAWVSSPLLNHSPDSLLLLAGDICRSTWRYRRQIGRYRRHRYRYRYRCPKIQKKSRFGRYRYRYHPSSVSAAPFSKSGRESPEIEWRVSQSDEGRRSEETGEVAERGE